MKKSSLNLLIAGYFAFCSSASAVTVPYVFQNGTTASANQVNSNFVKLKTAIDTLESDSNTLEKRRFVVNRNGVNVVSIGADTSNNGVIQINDWHGDRLIEIGNRASDGTGRIVLFTGEDGGTSSTWISATEVSSKVKNFVEPHPSNASKNIVYASIEGPEAAMYIRGTATLVGGYARITLPEHFGLLAAESGMTASLTPNSPQSLGLAKVALTPEFLEVQELQSGMGSYDFDYTVYAVRKGFEDYQVIRDKEER